MKPRGNGKNRSLAIFESSTKFYFVGSQDLGLEIVGDSILLSV